MEYALNINFFFSLNPWALVYKTLRRPTHALLYIALPETTCSAITITISVFDPAGSITIRWKR